MRLWPQLVKRHFIVSGVLVVGLIVSCIAMQAAFNSGNRKLTVFYAVSSAILCIVSSLSVFLQAVRYVEHKKLKSERERVSILSDHCDYKAKYSLKDRIVFSFLTAGSILLCCFFYKHTGHYWLKIVISAILIFCLVTVYRYFFTTVWFTDKLIVVEVKLFTNYSESYKSVTALRTRLGKLLIQFADGRTLNLPSGLGNSVRIASIIEERVKIASEYLNRKAFDDDT